MLRVITLYIVTISYKFYNTKKLRRNSDGVFFHFSNKGYKK